MEPVASSSRRRPAPLGRIRLTVSGRWDAEEPVGVPFIHGFLTWHHVAMTDERVWIRPYRLQDRQEAMSLAGRLEIGVAPWRDPDAVRATVVGWVRDSLDSCTAEDREVFVAVDAARLVGLVTVGQRQHFTGETDAYVGELVVAEGMERRGVGTLLMQAAEEWGR